MVIERTWWAVVTTTAMVLGTVSCSTNIGDAGIRKCNLVTNDRCNPGEMCIDAANERCVPEGVTALGATCTKDDDCEATAVCVGDADGKICKRKCSYKSSKCDAGLGTGPVARKYTPVFSACLL